MTTRSRRALRALGTTLLAALLAACASGPVIDDSHRSGSQGPRVDLLVIHYTVLDFPTSLRVLTQQEVSSHYLVRDDPPTIYRLVDENQRSNHAGVSAWGRRVLLNPSSIGIEIVNPGYTDTPQGRVYAPFPQAQVDAVIALVKDIVARHQIRPDRIIGHADIAPGRKQDPGPAFPWMQLAQTGIIPWPDAAQVTIKKAVYESGKVTPPDLAWVQARLSQIGYNVPRHGELDALTRETIATFQMKYRPANYSGELDAETLALLDVATTPGGMVMAKPVETATKPYTSRW